MQIFFSSAFRRKRWRSHSRLRMRSENIIEERVNGLRLFAKLSISLRTESSLQVRFVICRLKFSSELIWFNCFFLLFQIFHIWHAGCTESWASETRFFNFWYSERRTQAKGRVSTQKNANKSWSLGFWDKIETWCFLKCLKHWWKGLCENLVWKTWKSLKSYDFEEIFIGLSRATASNAKTKPFNAKKGASSARMKASNAKKENFKCSNESFECYNESFKCENKSFQS